MMCRRNSESIIELVLAVYQARMVCTLILLLFYASLWVLCDTKMISNAILVCSSESKFSLMILWQLPITMVAIIAIATIITITTIVILKITKCITLMISVNRVINCFVFFLFFFFFLFLFFLFFLIWLCKDEIMVHCPIDAKIVVFVDIIINTQSAFKGIEIAREYIVDCIVCIGGYVIDNGKTATILQNGPISRLNKPQDIDN